MLTRDQVLGLAPDPAAAKAGSGLASPARWANTGHDAGAVWGECAGSGTLPYRSQVDLGDHASSCSCPSRKFPCKHALGLLLLAADGRTAPATRPDWVETWIGGRAAKAVVRAEKAVAETPRAPASTRARDSKVDAGVAELQRWLGDLIAQGLASVKGRGTTDEMARRLVDAQARGLATRVEDLGALLVQGATRPGVAARLLDVIGHLHLLGSAWQHREQLPADVVAALRTRIGFTRTAQDVRTTGEQVTDTWTVVGERVTDDGRLRTRQQWAVGASTDRVVTLLTFSVNGSPMEPLLPAGHAVPGTLALADGGSPRRAFAVSLGEPVAAVPPGAYADLASALHTVSEDLVTDPFADTHLLFCAGCRLVPGTPWVVLDEAGGSVPLVGAAWAALAATGGRRATVVGLWDGRGLDVLAINVDADLVLL